MRRILYAMAISIAIFILYFCITITILFVLEMNNLLTDSIGDSVAEYMSVPFRLPASIFFYFHPTRPKGSFEHLTPIWIGLVSLFIFSNFVLYSIAAYFVLWLIACFRKPKTVQTELPPLPPTFENQQ